MNLGACVDAALAARRSSRSRGDPDRSRCSPPPRSALPPGEDWAYEVKWDGVRAIADASGDEPAGSAPAGAPTPPPATRSSPRSPRPSTGTGAILDGEIVAFDSEGNPEFGLLQRRMNVSDPGRIRLRMADTPVTYVAFDLLALGGRSLCDEPYEARRGALAGLGFDGPSWQAPAHHLGDGEAFFEAVRARGLEGVVAKRLGSPYRPGRRSADWVKVQNRRRQELVIGGWMPGEGLRAKQVGSLLVGYWDSDGKLVYAGGVGTGFTDETLRTLDRRARAARPRDEPVRGRLGPGSQVRDASQGPRWAALGRARARLRGRVPALDARGHAARGVVQGPA